MTSQPSFLSLYRHGFVRAAVAIPRVAVADPAANARETIRLAEQADASGAILTVFPELGLTSYAIDDLLQQEALLEGALEGLGSIVDRSKALSTILMVGLPVRSEARLFNCAAVIYRGSILGLVPKSFLPNYREYYEKRHFSAASMRLEEEVDLLGQTVPFSPDLVFDAQNIAGLSFHVELCEDLWTPIPPSTWGALRGATVLSNLSASNVTIDKASFRRSLVEMQSAKCVASYVYAGAGFGESTTDLAWDGHGLIAEYGDLLAESRRFERDSQILYGDIDLDRLIQERSRLSSFNDTVERYYEELCDTPVVGFDLELPEREVRLEREIPRFPYVPATRERLDLRCREAYNIQVQGLAKRLEATGIEKVVIGVSGGLDSTHALIVAVQAMEWLGHSHENVLAYTMPGYATSDLTRQNALALMDSLGVTAELIDIRPSCEQMLRDIGHPFSQGEPVHDVTFENVQAGERTSHLFRLANYHGALVVGTGDLSELALGWATYGVGDQMSHYNVNSSVPKTLIQHLIRWVIEQDHFGEKTNRVLQSIVDTEISPELVPASSEDQTPAQRTEEIIGPYELQDLNLYYISRYGYRPSKVAFLSHEAWSDRQRGAWPATIPDEDRREYELSEIKRWLEVFLRRFFGFSQFKRSALPNGPKVGSGGSLSPRGDWRAPSDSSPDVWLQELDRNVPD